MSADLQSRSRELAGCLSTRVRHNVRAHTMCCERQCAGLLCSSSFRRRCTRQNRSREGQVKRGAGQDRRSRQKVPESGRSRQEDAAHAMTGQERARSRHVTDMPHMSCLTSNMSKTVGAHGSSQQECSQARVLAGQSASSLEAALEDAGRSLAHVNKSPRSTRVRAGLRRSARLRQHVIKAEHGINT